MERCPGVISIHDDIVVYGVSEEDHDANLVNLLNVAQIEGLVLNSKKLELKRPRVSFFGAEYSADGMHPCLKKIQGITEMTPPWINNNWPASLEWSHTWETSCHISAIILNHSGQCSSKRWSLHGTKWQTPASRRSRISLPRAPPSHSDTMTQGNQSQYRRMPPKEDLVRAFYRMASQLHTPARASQTLRPGTQTSKESSLAIVFACQRFNTYVLGRPFTVESDHKPLEMIHQKSLASAPPRLQRMLLQLQRYNVTIRYRPGKEMLLADALSRCPSRASGEIKLDMRVDYIAFSKT